MALLRDVTSRSYIAIPKERHEDDESLVNYEDEVLEGPTTYIGSSRNKSVLASAIFAAIGVASLITAIVLLSYDKRIGSHLTRSSSALSSAQAIPEPLWPPTLDLKANNEQCTEPPLRHEWRALTMPERRSYISAVMCLRTLPSRTGLGHSLWEDFPYVHVWYGHDGHDGVSFFAYHRWLLAIYESAIRDQCGYQGRMVYWDWTLDWEDPYEAPVFDPVNGWGGDGDPRREDEGFRGGCIRDGPLVGIVHPYVEYLTKPHCLSRKFLEGDDRDFWARQWHPDRLQELLESTDLNGLIEKLEYTMHRALPKLVGGDFTTKGAPMDPLFFLHHAQLDRIYWMWQTRDPDYRLHNYAGRKTREDERNSARISDLLLYGDLGPPVTINDTMNIQGGAGGRLCYRYW